MSQMELYYENWRKKTLKELDEQYRMLLDKIESTPSSSSSVLDQYYQILMEMSRYIEQRRQQEEEGKNNG